MPLRVADTLAVRRYGSGPAVVFLRGLPAPPAPPSGLDALFERWMLRGIAATHTVYALGRPRGLEAGARMTDVASSIAVLLAARFDGPVTVIGLSTGASIALQLAADHPEVVSRVVVAAGAARLSDRGRAIQTEYGRKLRAGEPAEGEFLPAIGDFARLHRFAHAVSRLMPAPHHPRRVAALVDAEGGFDLTSRLADIRVPTLVLTGERDVFYPPHLAKETVAGIADAKLIVYRGRTHALVPLGRQFARDISSFLDDATN